MRMSLQHIKLIYYRLASSCKYAQFTDHKMLMLLNIKILPLSPKAELGPG